MHCTKSNDLVPYAQSSWEQTVLFTSIIPAQALWQEIVRHSINIGWMNKWMNQLIGHLENCLEESFREQSQVCREDHM